MDKQFDNARDWSQALIEAHQRGDTIVKADDPVDRTVGFVTVGFRGKPDRLFISLTVLRETQGESLFEKDAYLTFRKTNDMSLLFKTASPEV